MISSFAVTFILYIAAVLLLLFMLLLGYTYFHRRLLNLRRKKFAESEEYILPLIYQYLDGEITLSRFKQSLRHRYDIVVAFRNIDEIADSLKGAERKKLKKMLELSSFKLYFFKKLNARSVMDLADACMYFEKKVK